MATNHTLSPGTMLRGDAYRIERVLGRGGFGITYLAYDCGLDAEVTIKEFFPGMFCSRQDDSRSVSVTDGATDMVDGMKAKFLKEARRLAKLKINGVVGVHAAFEENGTAYYVMDYIEGGNLKDKVSDGGSLAPAEAMRYISQVAEALAALHERNINHLDIKPANIMLDRESGRAILIDFGLAKQYDEQGHQTSSTPTGLSHGYAPLEQYHQNGVRRFSPQADIYSLAATLYYLLSGEVPPHATDLLNEPLTFPDSIPAALRPVIARAMSQIIKDRPATVAEFMAQLNAAMADTSAPSAKPKRDTDMTVISTPKKVIKPQQESATVVAVPKPQKPLPWKWIIAAVAAIGVVVAAVIFWPSKGAEGEYGFANRPDAPNLSMAIRYNGDVYYVTEDEWAQVPEWQKNQVEKLGLVVKGDSLSFMLEPDDLTSEELTWDVAMARYSNRLPTCGQGKVIVKQHDEINRRLKNFGMSEMDYDWYWTRTERDSTHAWEIYMNHGYMLSSGKSSGFKVRAVSPIPSRENPDVTETKDTEFKFVNRAVAPNLSMTIRYNGEVYYVTEDEWAKVPEWQKNQVEKLGLVIKGNSLEFMLEPNDLTSEKLTWHEAMASYGNRLPDKAQAEVMAKQCDEIDRSQKSFGMPEMHGYYYWTCTEVDYPWAWAMYTRSVQEHSKGTPSWVRAVAPVPSQQSRNAAEATEFKFFNRSVAPNLSMVIRYKGEIYYVTEDEWAKVPEIIKNEVNKLGLVIKGNGLEFMLEPKDLTSEAITWDVAMARYGNRMPDKAQAEVIDKQHNKISSVLNSFGMPLDAPAYYWTRTKHDENSVYQWYAVESGGDVFSANKFGIGAVRAVTSVPTK